MRYRMKCLFKGAAIAFFILPRPCGLLAAPQIQSELTYIENRPPDDIFGFPGLYVLTRCDATDPGGISALIGPPAGATVSCNNNNFPFAQPASMSLAVSPSTAIFVHLFPITEADFPNVDGRYTYEVTNNSGQQDALQSHRLNRLEVIPQPTNLAVSDQTLTPTITFTDPAPSPGVSGLVRRYQVVVFDTSLSTVAVLPSPTTVSTIPEMTVDPGVLCPCVSYYLRAQSIDIDAGDDAFENMGQSFLLFTPTDVPTRTADANHDCLVNGRDIQPFTNALMVNSSAAGDTCPSDFNQNGVIDLGDISAFADRLISP